MAELLTRLGASQEASETDPGPEAGEETEARFLRAASDLRKMEWEPERAHDLQRRGLEASEEEWLQATRSLRASGE